MANRMQALNAAYCFILILLLQGFGLASGQLDFEDRRHNFGEKPFRSKVQHAFTFTNTGSVPVKIEDFYTACPCSQVFLPKASVVPGDKGEITVKYDATKLGKFNRKIVIYTTAGNYNLFIKGEIVESDKKVDPITGEVLEE